MDIERMLKLAGIKSKETKVLHEGQGRHDDSGWGSEIEGEEKRDIKPGDRIYSTRFKKITAIVFNVREGIVNGYAPTNEKDIVNISRDQIEDTPFKKVKGKLIWRLR